MKDVLAEKAAGGARAAAPQGVRRRGPRRRRDQPRDGRVRRRPGRRRPRRRLGAVRQGPRHGPRDPARSGRSPTRATSTARTTACRRSRATDGHVHVAAEAPRPSAHGRDRGGRHPGDHAARRRPDEPGRRPRLRPARARRRSRRSSIERHGASRERLLAEADAWRAELAGHDAGVRALLQRTTGASVRVDGEVVGAIEPGLVVLLGVGPADDEATADALARRVAELRIFRDDEGRTNRSLLDVGGAALRRLAVHAVRGHAARSPARVHRRGAAGAGRAALRAVRGRAAGLGRARSRPAGSGPRWRSSWSTTARSRSGSTPTSAEPRHRGRRTRTGRTCDDRCRRATGRDRARPAVPATSTWPT